MINKTCQDIRTNEFIAEASCNRKQGDERTKRKGAMQKIRNKYLITEKCVLVSGRKRNAEGGKRAGRAEQVNEGMASRRRRNESRTRGMTMAREPRRGFKTSTPPGKFTVSRIRPRH